MSVGRGARCGVVCSAVVCSAVACFAMLSLACSNDPAGVDSLGGGSGAADDQGTDSMAGTSGTTAAQDAGADATTSTDADDAADSSGGTKLDVAFEGDLGDGGEDSACAQAERLLSSYGCLFWAVDLPNSRSPAPGGVAEDHQYAIVVANNSPSVDAMVRIYSGDEDVPLDEALVPPEGTHAFALPAASIDPTQSTSDGVAYRVQSDIPITAYQFNPLQNSGVYSNDATVLWPQHVLTTDYTAVTDNATSAAATYLSIVATHDGTHVEVLPTTTLAIAGAPEATLQRGEVFTVVSVLSDEDPPNDGNLSGSRVVADQPVAAFSGNVSAPVIPSGGAWVGGARICCADHMEHQLLPLQTWGTRHVVATPAPAYYPVDPARYRVTGAFDATPLQWSPAAPPGAPESIDAGQTVVFETDASFAVASTDVGKAFSITQFLPSGDTTDSLFDDERRGDPAMIILPAVEQFEDRYVFAVPAAYATHAVTVVAPDGATVELDGVETDASTFVDLAELDGVSWVYAHLAVTEGTHVVTASQPVGLTVAGYDVEVSYGYAAGSGFETITVPPPPAG